MTFRMKAAIAAIMLAAVAGALTYAFGIDAAKIRTLLHAEKPATATSTVTTQPPPPAVTVAKVVASPLTETVLVTGTLVPREEILVAPEVSGMRIVDLKVDVGDRVAKGDILAVLEKTQLEAQLEQNTAAIARADATIAQAESQIKQAQAALAEAEASFDRAKPLKKSGYLSESVFDQRQAAARSTEAQLALARDGAKLASAAKAEAEAQRKELVWRLDNAEVRAPRAGLVSRRTARIGALASSVTDAMFRIIADGEIELEADVIEADLAKIAAGQAVKIEVAGAAPLNGSVRLVSPEIDQATRLGKVKIFIGDRPDLKIGAFGRGRIVTRETRGLSVPLAAVMYGPDTASVLRVNGDKVEQRFVKTGLRSGLQVQIIEGVAEGDLVVAKAGTFLRDGDRVYVVVSDPKVSEAGL